MQKLTPETIQRTSLETSQQTSQQISDMLVRKSLSSADYNPTHDAMLERTLERIALKKEQSLRTPDELWVVDHNDVYTLGQAGKEEHILQHTSTPIVKTDRGGQVTWHGHGQLVIYWLFDLHSLGWSVRNLVSHAEQAIEDVVNDCLKSLASSDMNNINDNINSNISAHSRRDAPGVYLYADMSQTHNGDGDGDVDNDNQPNLPAKDVIMLGKIASLGFKIKHGFSYHGIALNLNCDLSAFNAINPCGYAGMQMLRLADFVAMSEKQNQKQSENETQYEQTSKALSYEQITQKLIDNVAKRHAGLIELRPIASGK